MCSEDFFEPKDISKSAVSKSCCHVSERWEMPRGAQSPPSLWFDGRWTIRRWSQTWLGKISAFRCTAFCNPFCLDIRDNLWGRQPRLPSPLAQELRSLIQNIDDHVEEGPYQPQRTGRLRSQTVEPGLDGDWVRLGAGLSSLGRGCCHECRRYCSQVKATPSIKQGFIRKWSDLLS